MGLAASQARLLTLTSRCIDLELKCMRFSNQQIRNAQTACELSEDYNTQLDILKARSEDPNDELYANGYKMTSYESDGTSGTANLSGLDYNTLTSAPYNYVIGFGANIGNPNEDTFKPDSINYDSHVHLIPGQSFDSPDKYKQKAMSFISSYGSSNFQQEVVDITSEQYALSKGLTSKEYNQVRNYYMNSSHRNDSNPSVLMSEFYPHIGKDSTHIGEMHSLLQEYHSANLAGNNKKTIYKNEKGIEQSTWNTALTSAASAAGLNSSAFEQCVKNGGSITTENIQKSAGKYYVDFPSLGQSKPYSGYNAAISGARSAYKDSPEYKEYLNKTPVDKGSILTEAMNDVTKLWEYIGKGYLTITDKDGNSITNFGDKETYKNATYTLDKQAYNDAKDGLSREYEQQQKKLSLDDKKIQVELTQTQTELTACNQEIQSVKTLIDKNIEKGFSYGYNA